MKGLVLLSLVLFSLSSSFGQEWKHKKTDDYGIAIYTRSKENSVYKEYKISTTLRTTPEVILAELLDAPAYNEDACEPGISYYVEERAPNEHLFYAQKKLPWPFKNRDLVTLITVHRISDSKITLTMEGLPGGLPSLEKTLRIKTLMGEWTLEKDGINTQVTQQLYVDPEGSLPPVIVNSMLTKGPHKTFRDLKQIVESHNSTDLGR